MKNVLLTLLATLLTTVAIAQPPHHRKPNHEPKPEKVEVNVGLSVFAPITKDVSPDNRAWGQRVQLAFPKNDKFAYTLTLGYQQSKDRFVQIPVLAGLRYRAYKGIHIGLGTGATFFKNEKGRFVLSPSIGYRHKRLYIEQSLFRTTKFNSPSTNPYDGEHFNNIGFTIYYKL